MKLFWVAVILRPTKKDLDEGEHPRILLAPTAVLAEDERGAILAAGKMLEDSIPTDRIEVAVRPF